jgi:glycosyltransferase involved in cell wall biosynthesis
MPREPKVALVHEWFVSYAGSERVVEQLLKVFPEARVFSLVDFLDDAEREIVLGGRKTTTTFIQRLPGARANFRHYLPLMPLAVEQHDLSEFDIVISSSHAVAKGVLTGPDQLHISYVHSPIRYAWDLQHQYLAESQLTEGVKGWVAKVLLHYMRIWDARTANGVDYFVANSEFIARRINKAYRREARVIYPPVDTDSFQMQADKQPFYVTASRMVPYKRIPLIVEAFAGMPDRKLVVIGDGPDLARCKSLATPNIELVGYETTEKLQCYMRDASAFVFAAEEDFGITLVEAQACGTPVIAYGKGGALETVVDVDTNEEATGVLFSEQSVAAIRDAVLRFEQQSDKITAQACRHNAERFSTERFGREIAAYVETAWARHCEQYGYSYIPTAHRSIAAE